MRPSGTHLYKRVCPSVGPSVGRSVRRSVRYACAKTAFLGCFWPRWDPTLKQMINQHVLRVFSPVCSSICLSIHMSHDQYTLRHSPDASLSGRACFSFVHTALRYIDKDNFECPELGVVQKCSMILGEYQSPGGKFFWKQNFEKMPF